MLRYAEGGEFQPHYDANERSRRVLTVLIYLNSVGRTWFPLATPTTTARNPPRLTLTLTLTLTLALTLTLTLTRRATHRGWQPSRRPHGSTPREMAWCSSQTLTLPLTTLTLSLI